MPETAKTAQCFRSVTITAPLAKLDLCNYSGIVTILLPKVGCCNQNCMTPTTWFPIISILGVFAWNSAFPEHAFRTWHFQNIPRNLTTWHDTVHPVRMSGVRADNFPSLTQQSSSQMFNKYHWQLYWAAKPMTLMIPVYTSFLYGKIRRSS